MSAWRKGDVVIAVSTFSGLGRESKPGYLHESGLFGVHRSLWDDWIVDHLPTGMMAGSFDTLRDAKKFVEIMVTRPRLWNAGYEFGKTPKWSESAQRRRDKLRQSAIESIKRGEV